mmetsp:Transcript_12904/g.30615  ORF Transcript_12904/g.30615 Transcript_12904/m.30615 type:complete len:114 (-) Transcript_12904:161-502(-)|eukprot:CAMPEP_0113630310 /NCGR_PEP_ID=MMETSP0017_2-20120614/15746_1 /TAXON_ID=2856 /ORGANISM="Cylindrotheca closterium" /LENGTH=113 /DNA_ID=CAMNT_0000540765 /DNA_START=671 /DNA_END=1012 /DNA_ORIENTATION=+ /assembly_acc=CAM_ASM_000147
MTIKEDDKTSAPTSEAMDDRDEDKTKEDDSKTSAPTSEAMDDRDEDKTKEGVEGQQQTTKANKTTTTDLKDEGSHICDFCIGACVCITCVECCVEFCEDFDCVDCCCEVCDNI